MAQPDLFSLVRHNRYKQVQDIVERNSKSSSGFDADQRDAFGNTLLLTSCQNGLKGMAKLMLRHGADIDAANDKGNSALHFCALFGYWDTLGAYLISKGCDAAMTNMDGLPAENLHQKRQVSLGLPVDGGGDGGSGEAEPTPTSPSLPSIGGVGGGATPTAKKKPPQLSMGSATSLVVLSKSKVRRPLPGESRQPKPWEQESGPIRLKKATRHRPPPKQHSSSAPDLSSTNHVGYSEDHATSGIGAGEGGGGISSNGGTYDDGEYNEGHGGTNGIDHSSFIHPSIHSFIYISPGRSIAFRLYLLCLSVDFMQCTLHSPTHTTPTPHVRQLEMKEVWRTALPKTTATNMTTAKKGIYTIGARRSSRETTVTP
jgi:hypothetical protein